MIRPTPRSTLLPYTTLFRSENVALTRTQTRTVEEAVLHLLAEDGRRIELPVAIVTDRNPDRTLKTIRVRSEEHTSELQSRQYLVCRLLLEKKKTHAPPEQHK